MDTNKLIIRIIEKIRSKEKISYKDFAEDNDKFGDLIEMIQDAGYIKDANVIRGGIGNKVQAVLLQNAKVTLNGINLIENNSDNNSNVLPDEEININTDGRQSYNLPPQFPYQLSKVTQNKGNINIANDYPSSEDKLDRKNFAQAFAKYIAYKETKPPLSIGIFGDWGTGKSSFLNLIEEDLKKLEGDNYVKVNVVKFNAWEYEEQEKIWFGMLKSIIDDFLKKKGFIERLIFKIKNSFEFKDLLINSVKIFVTLAVGILIIKYDFIPNFLNKVGIDLSVPKNIAKISVFSAYLAVIFEFGKDIFAKIVNPIADKFNTFMKFSNYDNEIGKREIVKEDLKKIEKWLDVNGKLKEKLVIYIDDLDRCSHEKIIKVLEATQLFLNKKGIITVFGLDYRVMRVAIENNFIRTYKSDENNSNPLIKDFIEEYIEKFIQIPFFIPNPDIEAVGEYLRFMCNINNNQNEGIDNHRIQNHEDINVEITVIQNSNNISKEEEKIEFTTNEFKLFSEIITKYVKSNARNLKKIRNLVLLNKQIYFSSSEIKSSFIDYMTWFIFHSVYTNEANIFLNECKNHYLINPEYTINDVFDFNGLICTPKDKGYGDYKFELDINAKLYIDHEVFKNLSIDRIIEFSKLSSAFIYPIYNNENVR